MKNETLPRLCKIKLQRVFAKPALSHKGVNQITAKTYTQKEIEILVKMNDEKTITQL